MSISIKSRIGQPDCSQLDPTTPACQDCAFGAHATDATTFWTQVNSFFGFSPINTPIVPNSFAFSTIVEDLNNATMDQSFYAYIPAGNTPSTTGNQDIEIGFLTGNPNPDYSTMRSLTLMNGIVNNLTVANGGFFNFYKAINPLDGSFCIVFTVSNASGQVLYYCDFSSVVP
jgi:hypothetical protein